jgi:predicted nucleic-acid-binding protein
MIAFDTNHLLRHILQDDPKQCKHVATSLQNQAEQKQTVLIIDLVVMETYWVLTNVYDLDRRAWSLVLESLLSDTAFGFENASKLRRALHLYREAKADFSDYLILTHAQSLGANLETFDKKLKKSI